MTPTTTIQIATSVDPHEDRDAIIGGLRAIGLGDAPQVTVSEPADGLITVAVPTFLLPSAMDALINFIR